MIMKPRNLCLAGLLFVTLVVRASAADPTPKSQDAYRDYLETYRKTEEAYSRSAQIRIVVLLTTLAGVIVFVVVPASRRARAALEISERQQKTLEEIRDLLRGRNS